MIVVRKIRNGRVKIFSRWFRPSDQFMKYDGRLDGMKYAFGVYMNYDLNTYTNFVSLWGSERALTSKNIIRDWPGLECIDGSFVWMWWHQVAK